MGIKGDKMKEESIKAAEILVEKLSSIEGFTSKKMFGGHGLFSENKMFGLIDSKGISFLKVDDELKSDLVSKGGIQHSRMPYYSIPDSILNDEDQLLDYARKSIVINSKK